MTAEDEVATLCRDLIRIDTSNYGDHSGPGERLAAEYVAGLLSEVGLEPVLLESHPGRASVVTRMTGEDPSRPALLIHGHLDVVPADAADWAVPPFSGEVVDGTIWGRGAVDMKDMDAMTLAVVRQRMREGRRPPRDVVLAFLADEEAGGNWGGRWLVDNHAHLFEGVTEAISEVGGFSATIGGQRLYLVQTAEKGMAWLRLTARGTAGHGSLLQSDNAVTELAETVARIGRHEWPTRLTPSAQAFMEAASEALGLEFTPAAAPQVLAKLGPLARMIGATLANTANPTMLNAGYKVNVVPGVAAASVDGRFLPGCEEEFLAELDSLLGPGSPARVHQHRHRPGDHLRRRPVRGHDGGPAGRGPGRQDGALLHVRAGPTRSRSAGWASGASASRPCACPPTPTSSGCSTAWTNGCRWTPSGSACGCSTASSTAARRPLNDGAYYSGVP